MQNRCTFWRVANSFCIAAFVELLCVVFSTFFVCIFVVFPVYRGKIHQCSHAIFFIDILFSFLLSAVPYYVSAANLSPYLLCIRLSFVNLDMDIYIMLALTNKGLSRPNIQDFNSMKIGVASFTMGWGGGGGLWLFDNIWSLDQVGGLTYVGRFPTWRSRWICSPFS
jgi:hypothetical protein